MPAGSDPTPEGAFALEAEVTMPAGGDPAAIGAAVTVELCGHWEHEGPCRWPHHTEVVESAAGNVRVRTVIHAQADRPQVERRVREALDRGALRSSDVEADWSLYRVREVPLRSDEVELARRIAVRPGD